MHHMFYIVDVAYTFDPGIVKRKGQKNKCAFKYEIGGLWTMNNVKRVSIIVGYLGIV